MAYGSLNHNAVVLIHGLFSSAETWGCFTKLASSDPELAGFSLIPFAYNSPKYNMNPLRRIPDFDTLGDSFQRFFEVDLRDYQSLVLVSHSQGGLIIQRFLAKMVTSSRANDLKRIRRVIMFACPNAGSELLLFWRRLGFKFWPHAQESELRPLNDAVARTSRIVLQRIVYAKETSADEIPIPIMAYAGDSDNIVPSASAMGFFPTASVLPGDHFSIIQADSVKHSSYLALKSNLLASHDDESMHRPSSVRNAKPDGLEEVLRTSGENRSMAWDTALNAVVAALASAIADTRKIRTLVVQGGLDPAEMDLEGTPHDRWQAAIEQAYERDEKTVDNLLHLALRRSKNMALHQTVDSYWQQRDVAR